jgi:uncharacterized repeat protein (TIGR01451 family)
MNKKPFLILFVVVLLGLAGFAYYRGGMFSSEILKLEISGPDTAKIGDEIEYTVQYKNNGNFVLQKAKLIFELPENSLTEDGKVMFTQNLKDIYPGTSDFIKFKGRLLGNEGDLKIAKVSLSYVPENITAPYESNVTFTTKIDVGSINLKYDLPPTIEQDKILQYSINYFSNVNYPLENLSIKIDPTPGFDFISAEPTSLDNSEWKLSTLSKDQGGKISISGRVSGKTNDNLTFSASLGKWIGGNFVVIKKVSANVQVVASSLSISQQINGSTSYVASLGEVLHYKILIKNIGVNSVDNLSISSKFDSSNLDMSTIKTEDAGQIRVDGDTIIWEALPLYKLVAQQEGQVSFSVRVKNSLDSPDNNVESVITNEVNVSEMIKKFTTKINLQLVAPIPAN